MKMKTTFGTKLRKSNRRPPLVSVIMPVYNAGRFVKLAIKSIQQQTYSDWELIIINDGVRDATISYLQKLESARISILHNDRHRGITYSLNRGLRHAKGTYIARMDADDVALPQRFERQVNFFAKNHDVALVGSCAWLIDTVSQRKRSKTVPLASQAIKSQILLQNPFIHPTVMFRRSVISAVGGYDETYEGAEDYDLFLRITSRYRVGNLAEPLIEYRIHPDSVSSKNTRNILRQAVRVRWHALNAYGYPWWQIIYLVPSLITLGIPSFMKRLMNRTHEI